MRKIGAMATEHEFLYLAPWKLYEAVTSTSQPFETESVSGHPVTLVSHNRTVTDAKTGRRVIAFEHLPHVTSLACGLHVELLKDL